MDSSKAGRKLNLWLLAAALLMLLTIFAHVFAGGPEIYTPMRNSMLPAVIISVLSVIWHAITLILMLIAGSLFWLSRNGNFLQNAALAYVIALVQIGFALLFIGYGAVDLGTLWPMPQWIIFILDPTLIALGYRKS